MRYPSSSGIRGLGAGKLEQGKQLTVSWEGISSFYSCWSLIWNGFKVMTRIIYGSSQQHDNWEIWWKIIIYSFSIKFGINIKWNRLFASATLKWFHFYSFKLDHEKFWYIFLFSRLSKIFRAATKINLRHLYKLHRMIKPFHVRWRTFQFSGFYLKIIFGSCRKFYAIMSIVC